MTTRRSAAAGVDLAALLWCSGARSQPRTVRLDWLLNTIPRTASFCGHSSAICASSESSLVRTSSSMRCMPSDAGALRFLGAGTGEPPAERAVRQRSRGALEGAQRSDPDDPDCRLRRRLRPWGTRLR